MTHFNEKLIEETDISALTENFLKLYQEVYLKEPTENENRRVEKVIGLAALETLKEMEVGCVTAIGRDFDEKLRKAGRIGFSRLHGVFVNKTPGFGIYLDFGLDGTIAEFYPGSMYGDVRQETATGEFSSSAYSQALPDRTTVTEINSGGVDSSTYRQIPYNADEVTENLYGCGIIPITKIMVETETKFGQFILGEKANRVPLEVRTARCYFNSTHMMTRENLQNFIGKFQKNMQEIAARYKINIAQHLTKVEAIMSAFGKQHFANSQATNASSFWLSPAREALPSSAPSENPSFSQATNASSFLLLSDREALPSSASPENPEEGLIGRNVLYPHL